MVFSGVGVVSGRGAQAGRSTEADLRAQGEPEHQAGSRRGFINYKLQMPPNVVGKNPIDLGFSGGSCTVIQV